MSEIISLSEVRKRQGNTSKSKSQSKPNTQSARAGEIPTDDEDRAMMAIYLTIEKARFSPFTTKSDFARMAANEIALAASEGLISTRLDNGVFCNKWMITQEGLQFLEEMQDDYGPD